MRVDDKSGHKNPNRSGLILILVFAGALVMGVHSAARWAVELRQQWELKIPEWIPRLILENAVLAIRRILS
jgi:hypothetical protein